MIKNTLHNKIITLSAPFANLKLDNGEKIAILYYMLYLQLSVIKIYNII